MTSTEKKSSILGLFIDALFTPSEATESRYHLEGLVREHNAKYENRLVLLREADVQTLKDEIERLSNPEVKTTRKCTAYTTLADCEDRDCFRHYEAKKRIGKPTGQHME